MIIYFSVPKRGGAIFGGNMVYILRNFIFLSNFLDQKRNLQRVRCETFLPREDTSFMSNIYSSLLLVDDISNLMSLFLNEFLRNQIASLFLPWKCNISVKKSFFHKQKNNSFKKNNNAKKEISLILNLRMISRNVFFFLKKINQL